MKKKILLILLVMVLVVTGCGKKEEISDAKKFAKEYNTVSEDNYFVYRDSEEIIKILENGTGIVYLGFPECPWCQAYVPYLNEVADMEGLEKIYYYNILNDRKDNTDAYKRMVSLLDKYLQFDEEGNKRIYVPAVISVVKGEIVSFDDETSYDTKGYDDPADYWDEDAISKLKVRLTDMVNMVIDNKCTDCNK